MLPVTFIDVYCYFIVAC